MFHIIVRENDIIILIAWKGETINMVLKEGQDNGVGVWEIEGQSKLEGRIRDAALEGLEKQEYADPDDVSIEDILIVGSFGSGLGVPEKSDLDIMILVWYSGDSRSSEFSSAMEAIASGVNYRSEQILAGFNEFNGLETYVYPFLEMDQHLGEMAGFEPVTHYYNLTESEKRSYY